MFVDIEKLWEEIRQDILGIYNAFEGIPQSRTPKIAQDIGDYLSKIGFLSIPEVFSDDISRISYYAKLWQVRTENKNKIFSKSYMNDLTDLLVEVHGDYARVTKTESNETKEVSTIGELAEFINSNKIDYSAHRPMTQLELNEVIKDNI